MNTIRMVCAVAMTGSLLALTGCASQGAENVERDFGNSVRNMIALQTADPAAPVDDAAIDHGDGMRINGAIDGYRNGMADPEKVKEEFDFGTDSSGK